MKNKKMMFLKNYCAEFMFLVVMVCKTSQSTTSSLTSFDFFRFQDVTFCWN